MSYQGKKVAVVSEYVTDFIRRHSLQSGSRLPTENELIQATGVSRVTLRRALANLQESRLIYSIQGSGYFVGEKAVPADDAVIPMIISYNQENSKILNVVQGAQNYLRERHITADVHVSRRNPLVEREMLMQFFDQGIRHAIVFPVSSEDNNEFYFHLIQSGMNLTFIDRHPVNVSCCNLVQCDNMTGGYLATKHLIEQGHKNIAMFGLDPMMHASTIYERYLGYRHALKEFDLPEPEKSYFYAPYKRKNEDVEQLLDPANGFTAVFAINDYAAIDIANHAYAQGIRVPDDLSVVGFDNLAVSTLFTPHLTTIDQPFTKLGEVAAEIAYKSMNGEIDGYVQKTLPVRLMVRDSTRFIG